MAGRVLELPIRNPRLFSPEINREALAQGKMHALFAAAIEALPYVASADRRENLKRALCDVLLWEQAS